MILDQFSLKGKVAIVTGSNTGLGQGISRAFVEAGAKVVGVSRRPSTETEEMLGKENFYNVLADLSSCDVIPEVVGKTLEHYGRVDILVNNAGIIKRQDSIEFSEENWDSVINVNLKTVFFLTQAVAKQYIKQGTGGKVINIASMLSYQGGIRVPSYTASKSAIRGITMTLANEWAKYNINVNAIAPGYMATNNTQQLRQDEERSAELYLHTVEQMARHGFLQYEVSNFARPGFESRHNLKYWRCEQYLGLGPAAHSFWEGRRFYFPRDLAGFVAAQDPWALRVDDGPGGELEEQLMLRLRLCEGISLDWIREHFSSDTKKLEQRARFLQQHGLTRLEGDRLRLTPQGFLVSNSVIVDLLETVEV